MTPEPATPRVLPDYAGGGILNWVSSIAAHFGVATGLPGLREPLPIAGVETVIVFLIDGLGQWQLEKHVADGDAPNLKTLLESGQHRTLTSVFPSTTMAAMTGVNTGVTPARSGWLGFTLWLEEVGAVVEMIGQVDVATGQPLPDRSFLATVPSLASKLEGAGVNCFAVQPSEYRGMWLDGFYWAGASRSGFLTTNTLPSVTENVLEQRGRKYVMVYCPDYDTVCHRHGPSSPHASDELSATDHALGRLLKRVPRDGKTLLVVTADHGQKDLRADGAVYLERDADLMALLEGPPAGERVSRTLRVKAGALDEVKARLAGSCDLIESGAAWEAGLFGGPPALETFRGRVGDLIAMPRNGSQLLYTYPGHQPVRPHLGSHGGWSSEEMTVPFLAVRL